MSFDAQIAKLDSLKLAGLLSEEEYTRAKNNILNGTPTPPPPSPTSLPSPISPMSPSTPGLRTPTSMALVPLEQQNGGGASQAGGQGLCTTHGKMRPWNQLIALGANADGSQIFTCAPASPCTGSASSNPNAMPMGIGLGQMNNGIVVAPTMPTDWICANCGAHNHHNLKTCFQCQAPVGGVGVGFGNPVAQQGDWFCRCGDFNKSWSHSCNSCGAPGEMGTYAVPGTPIPIAHRAKAAWRGDFGQSNRFNPYARVQPRPELPPPVMERERGNSLSAMIPTLAGIPGMGGNSPMGGMGGMSMGGYGGGPSGGQPMLPSLPPPIITPGSGAIAPVVQKEFGKSVKISPLGADATEEDIRVAMEEFGPVESLVLKLDGVPPYAYINYTGAEAVNQALGAKTIQIGSTLANITTKTGLPYGGLASSGVNQLPNQNILQQRAAAAMPAKPMVPDFKQSFFPHGGRCQNQWSDSEQSSGLALLGLPLTTVEEEVWARVRPLGAQEVKMVLKDCVFSGTAFAYFQSIDAANAAKEELVGLTIGGQPFEIKYAMKGKGTGVMCRGRLARY